MKTEHNYLVKTSLIGLTELLLFAGFTVSTAAAASEKLEVYLLREVTIDPEVIDLEHVAILQGNESYCQKAKTIRLGQFALPGQVIRVDRMTILSRLAAVGIPAQRVSVTGAQSTAVHREASGVSGQSLADMARQFLETRLKSQGLLSARPLKIPRDQTRLVEGQAQVVPSLRLTKSPGRREVILTFQENGRTISRLTIPFQVRFRVKQPMAAYDISEGSVIAASAVRLEDAEAPEPLSDLSMTFAGKIAQRDIAAGETIRPQWLTVKSPPVVVERRQKVILKIERGPLVITAVGEAMDEGRPGDVIRVKRGIRPDERIVVGTVKPDGSIEPML